MINIRGKFNIDDIAQQIVGSLVLGGPFVVTEEVWSISEHMTVYNVILTFVMVLVLAYSILYIAVLRDPDQEAAFGVVPLRFVSLIAVSYLSGIIVSLTTGAASVFIDASSLIEFTWILLKTSTIISIFTVIGAGTADTVFGSPDLRDPYED